MYLPFFEKQQNGMGTAALFLFCVGLGLWLLGLTSTPAHAILAGGEFDLPEDRPSWRVDGGGLESGLNFVGALEMTLEGRRYPGTGV